MVDFKRISDRAKDLVEKRGGSDSLKRDAGELREIAKGPGSFQEKAKAALGALKEPGQASTRPAPAPAAEANPGERARATGKVQGEERGKHRRAGHDGGDGDPAV